MNISVSKGCHHENTWAIFDPGELDAFMRADVIGAFYGCDWHSVLVTDSQAAMLHWFVPRAIGNTGYFDIEPWFGYAGPTFKHANHRFVRRAFELYGECCRERSIIAELIRFDPQRENHLPFEGLPDIHIVPGRPICYAPILRDTDDAQLRMYAATCRRRIAMARKSMRVVQFDGADGRWDRFLLLYHESMKRVRAAARWFFDASVFHRIRLAEPFSVWATLAGPGQQTVASALLRVASSDVAHSLLMANANLHVYKGANDLLIHEVVRASSRGPFRWLCLGGGRTASPQDSLFAFKRKFAGANIRRLMVGFVAHVPEAVATLNGIAETAIIEAREMQPSTEIVQRFMPYRLVSTFADSGALS